MIRVFFLFGCVFGFLGVAFGAFGAHGLEGHLSARQMQVYETAVRYQFLHAFALLTVSLAGPHAQGLWLTVSGVAFATGILVFSGSLYLLVFTGMRAWGAVTPLGGLMLLGGWACLAVAAFRGMPA